MVSPPRGDPDSGSGSRAGSGGYAAFSPAARAGALSASARTAISLFATAYRRAACDLAYSGKPACRSAPFIFSRKDGSKHHIR